MSSRTAGLLAAGAGALVLAWPAPAAAELVFLSSGRTLSVHSHEVRGDTIVLRLRNGGEVICDRSLVLRIEPDEVPYPDPGGPALAAATPLPSTPYGDIIDTAAARHGVDPALVRAVIAVESSFRPRARSPKGAMGLMQLMPATARQYGVRDPYDPHANIEAGIRHLRSLLDRFDLSLALAAYNAGEGAVRRFGGIPPYRETRAYVARVLSLVHAAGAAQVARYE